MPQSLAPLFAGTVAGLLFLCAFPSLAQQYRWVDDKGRVQYTDTPPPASAKDVQKKNLKGNVVEAVVPFELTRATRNAPVTLYTSPPCGQGCEQARSALNARGVPYREIQVWDDKSNAELRRISGGDKVPVLVVGSQVQNGYEQSAFDRMLDAGGYPKAGTSRPGKQQALPMPEDYKPTAPEPASKR